jgi:hypothetical protein
MLQIVLMNENRFTGPLEDRFGNPGLQQLQLLDLRSNEFTGTIPPSLGNLPSLGLLTLHFNSFEDDVPQELCGITDFPNTELTADCLGVDPLVNCTCCTLCCDETVIPPCERPRRLVEFDTSSANYNHVPQVDVPSTAALRSDDPLALKIERVSHEPHRNLQRQCPGVSYLWDQVTGELTLNSPPGR